MHSAPCSARLGAPRRKKQKCNSAAIMHIWYLKSPCLMVIFVRNWIYYKMCSDMKHVAAGSLLSYMPVQREGKKKKEEASDGEINRISEWELRTAHVSCAHGVECSGSLACRRRRRRGGEKRKKRKVWAINWIKGTWCQSLCESRLQEKDGPDDRSLVVSHIVPFQGWVKL